MTWAKRDMGVATGIMVYLVTWWTVLFAVLPWGATAPETVEPGLATSAPARPNLLRKFAATTVIAAVLWLGIYLMIRWNVVSFRSMVRTTPLG